MVAGFIRIKPSQLNLSLTLKSGQSFRWKQCHGNENRFVGILKNIFVIELIQSDTEIAYRLLNSDHCFLSSQNLSKKSTSDLIRRILEDYFRLDVDLDALFRSWSKNDTNFRSISTKFKGVRLLRQDFIENCFSFICSSNNNISRITQMIEKLCRKFGSKLYEFADDEKSINKSEDIYSFPSIETLAEENVEQQLRDMGFGYRAKFINQTACSIKNLLNDRNQKDSDWIKHLRSLSYRDARKELMSLPGIGGKVADCICLMSLDFTESIPIDTHVFQLTMKHYIPDLGSKQKSMTPKLYDEIGDFYRNKFQLHAGWAQTVLFCSDLKINKSRRKIKRSHQQE
ncbi:N-glycosylase/DNA lyase [Sarcoptes scabiei]|uniref:N-glycosylase/DNA lyase n=1 Tax=Sarcoptes scabiei TaxID=52283 RepID=A0A834RBL7_SARSC|nr:N-glycosylase/DNA lyase [Sarcoptes scabiei]